MKAARPGGPCPPCPPCPGPAAPARPQPQPGQGSLAWRGAQWARLAHQSKLSRPEGEAPRTPRRLPLQQHPSWHLPQTPGQTTADRGPPGGGEQLQSEDGEEGKGSGGGKGKGGSFPARSLLAAPPAQAGK